MSGCRCYTIGLARRRGSLFLNLFNIPTTFICGLFFIALPGDAHAVRTKTS